jgi:uncharacterized protein
LDLFVLVLAFTVMFVGLISVPFGFPGTAIILAGILIEALYTGFSGPIGPLLFAAMCALTLIAETADNWLTMIGARRYGASTSSVWLSFVGGLVGAIVIGAPLAVVVGPLGPIVGGFVGAVGIVVLQEYRRARSWDQALQAGWGTFLGRMAGIMLKMVIAVAMIVIVVIAIVS